MSKKQNRTGPNRTEPNLNADVTSQHLRQVRKRTKRGGQKVDQIDDVITRRPIRLLQFPIVVGFKKIV